MQRCAILLLGFLFILAEKAISQPDASSDSLMDRAQNAVAQETEQLTGVYGKDLEGLAKLYEQLGDLLAKAAADAELTRVRQTKQIIVPNLTQLPAGVAALQKDCGRRLGEEIIRVLRPLVAQRRDDIAKRKQVGDFATAMIMEKELNAVCERFGWRTKKFAPNSPDIPRHPTPKYPLPARREHMTGAGLFFLEVDTISGAVTHVTVWKSTGHSILDEAAVAALQQWRFAPHTVVEAEVPITFNMNSKSSTSAGKH